jgi:hypothetical protein
MAGLWGAAKIHSQSKATTIPFQSLFETTVTASRVFCLETRVQQNPHHKLTLGHEKNNFGIYLPGTAGTGQGPHASRHMGMFYMFLGPLAAESSLTIKFIVI